MTEAASPGSSKPNSSGMRTRWPLEDTGRNSVRAWMRPQTTAVSTASHVHRPRALRSGFAYGARAATSDPSRAAVATTLLIGPGAPEATGNLGG